MTDNNKAQKEVLSTGSPTLALMSDTESIDYPPSDSSSSDERSPNSSPREYFAGKGQGLTQINDRLRAMIDRTLCDANFNTIESLSYDEFIHLNKHAADLTVQVCALHHLITFSSEILYFL